ncbi:LysM peptidoglycan-binding domain-containing protein [Halanaerobacter jeridensis]|uniref:LysM repeat protein n=1 Tax=Halanaerobacter jeridensis TaxID=706427 RepID=A0A938XVH2_9FIRM|nr:LysM domain-containing protein [Halanaerobacter jeridensis]MBM7556352.1 LysM repeat protein [Halanaerobacter jeridensis]
MSDGRKCKGEVILVRAGDTLYKIAQRYGITLESLYAANPQLGGSSQIDVGQKLCIPTANGGDEFIKEAVLLLPPMLPTLEENNLPIPYDLGGTMLLQQIDDDAYEAVIFATGLPSLEELGNFDSYVTLVTRMNEYDSPPEIGNYRYTKVLKKTTRTAGGSLQPVWSGTLGTIDPEEYLIRVFALHQTTGRTSEGNILIEEDYSEYGTTYRIQAGDTLSKVAEKYNLTLDQLLAVNPDIGDPSQIFVGQTIVLPPEASIPRKYTAVMTASDYFKPVPPWTGGVVLAQYTPDRGYVVTFGAVGIPPVPEVIGDELEYDSYLATINIQLGFEQQLSYYAVLERVVTPVQGSIWAGTVILPPELPYSVQGAEVNIRPYYQPDEISGAEILLSGKIAEEF